MERLTLRRDGDWRAFARMLATLHRTTGPRYGWHRDNYIGLAPQQNGWCDDWAEFWRTRRIGPQLEAAARNGFRLAGESVLQGCARLLAHRPAASLLHGDLWSGNAGFSEGAPVLFDPAVYYGDRECDLAMTELFGGFPESFYEAYESELPLETGYETRKTLYNLYHLLNHLNLFGGGYLPQVESTLSFLRDLL